ncbi:hypothetical protein TorRG33x02_260720, partial [Trema orientale]
MSSMSKGSSLNPALVLRTRHCLYVSGLSTLSEPSQAMTFITSRPRNSFSNISLIGSSRVKVASATSKNEAKLNSASRKRVTKNGALYEPFTVAWTKMSG